MTMRNVFGTTASGAQRPGGDLDANFNDMGQLMGITQCSATGTNAITLTPAANQPNVSSPLPANMQQFLFVPAATSTGAVTAQVGSGSFVPVFEPNGIQAGANSMVTTSSYIVTFLTALNAGAGGFVIAGGFTNVAPVIRSYLAGCTMSTAGGSGTMSVTAGVATSDDQTTSMVLAAIAKTTSAWAVGNNNGGLDTGAIANATGYHFYVIERTDTGVVDVLFSLSATTPTLPVSYTKQRRIGWGLTDGAAHWTAFVQFGDWFYWKASVLDSNGVAQTNVAANQPMSVPSGVQVIWRGIASNLAGAASHQLWVYTPSMNDEAAANTESIATTQTANSMNSQIDVLTDTAKNVRVVADSATGTYSLRTLAWMDYRGRFA